MSFKLNPASGTLATLTSALTTNTVTMTVTTTSPVGTTNVDLVAYWSAFPGETSVPSSTEYTNTLSLVVSNCDPVLVLTSTTNYLLYYKSGGGAAAVQKTIYVSGCPVTYTFIVKVDSNTKTNSNYSWLTVDSATSPGPTFLKI